jgi:PPOX class probable F420-dependent enzyme
MRTVAQVVRRLEESRRMRLAMLAAWPDEPHLDNTGVLVERFGPLNATSLYLLGLMHEDRHLPQVAEIVRQARQARGAEPGPLNGGRRHGGFTMENLSPEQRGRVEERLRTDQIVWFGTVRADGQPHLVPVWFLWDGESVLVFSKPDQKVRDLRANPRATLHFNSTPQGGEVVVLEGTAELLEQPSGEVAPPAYFEKYAAGIVSFGSTPEQLMVDYPQPIRFRPTKILAW